MISLIRVQPLLKYISRPADASLQSLKSISTGGFPLQFKVSPQLWAEPLKAKKRLDPAIIKAREDRKKRKVEKLIRKRLRLDRQLKPITELELPACLATNFKERERPRKVLSEEVQEERFLLFKKWCRARYHESKEDMKLIDKILYSQQIALNELRLESEELYQAAVRIDENLIPFKYNGAAETPPIENYSSPDGEYIDTSKKW